MNSIKKIDYITKKVDLNDPRDDKSLVELVRKTEIPGLIRYIYDRFPSYHKFAQTQGREYSLLGAYHNNNLIGSAQITLDNAYLNNHHFSIAYSGDVRILPNFKGNKIADTLIVESCKIDMPVFGAVMGSNRIILEKKLNAWKKLGVDFKLITKMKVLLFKAKKGKLQHQLASPKDLSQMYELWKDVKCYHNLARYYKNFEEFLSSYDTPGVSLQKTILIKKDNELLGFISVWNQSQIRKIEVKKISNFLKIPLFLIRLFANFPHETQELPLTYSFQHCFHSKLLQTPELILSALKDAQLISYNEKCIAFCFGLDEKDPLYNILKRKSLFENQVHIICHNEPKDLSWRNFLFHLEVGLG
jgi:hypothetical protein